MQRCVVSFLLVVLLLAESVRLIAGSVDEDTAPIRIGFLLPPEESGAASLREGATLGIERGNESGGPQARLIVRGRTGPWGADGVEAARMATDDGVQGLIAPPDGAATHLVLQVSGRTAVPVITLCPDASVTRTGVPWVARVVPSNEEEAKLIFSSARAERWTALIPDGRNGRELGRELRQTAAQCGRSLSATIELGLSTTNLARVSRQVLTNHPDAVLLWLDPKRAGALARALRSAGFRGVLAGPGRLRSAEFATAAGDAMAGFRVAAPVAQDSLASSFDESFRSRFGHEPDADAIAAYDAATLMLRILRDAGARPALDAFPLLGATDGASGPLVFDFRGNRTVSLQLLEGRGAHYVPVRSAANP